MTNNSIIRLLVIRLFTICSLYAANILMFVTVYIARIYIQKFCRFDKNKTKG